MGAHRYRRRQNLYAKKVEELQRALDVQRLIHNWVRPHWSLNKGVTPSMAMDYSHCPVSIHELLMQRGFYLSLFNRPVPVSCYVLKISGSREEITYREHPNGANSTND
jgi:hypothetical protein